jgi:hypothetical protein
MDAFHAGTASTLVATDIAARGIHVDDVALVVHADPPVEHKAYTHRSGRTARAGQDGTVVTLMTDDQVSDVRALTRAAGIKPTTTRVQGVDHPLLQTLAPGERVLVPGGLAPAHTPEPQGPGRRSSGSSPRNGGGNGAGGGGRGRRGPGQPRRSEGQGSAPAGRSGGPRSGGKGRGGRGGSGGPTTYTTSSPGLSGSSSHSAASFSGRSR